MMTHVIILPDHVFDRYVMFYEYGPNRVSFKKFEDAEDYVRRCANTIKEVPINSKIGRQILERIGKERI